MGKGNAGKLVKVKMSLYELTRLQAKNLQALILDSNIKGSAAREIVDLLSALDRPVGKGKKDDLHRKHNDSGKHSKDKP